MYGWESSSFLCILILLKNITKPIFDLKLNLSYELSYIFRGLKCKEKKPFSIYLNMKIENFV